MEKKILLTVCSMLLLLVNAYTAPPAVVNFKIMAHQRIMLEYKNTMSQVVRVDFRNDGDKDSVITRKIDLPVYTVLLYTMPVFKIDTPLFIKNSLYLKNGDTVLLEIDKDFHLVSKTPGNPIINTIIHFPDLYSEKEKANYRLEKENTMAYYNEIERIYLTNQKRIDSISNRQHIDDELKGFLIRHAAIEYDVMIIHPVITNTKIPAAYAALVKACGERLSKQPTIVDNLDLQESLATFITYCRYEIISAGKPINLTTLTTQAFKSEWSKSMVVAYVSDCLDSEQKKDSPAFKATYQSLMKYASIAEFPQLVRLKKKYFPVINNKDKIILLKEDGSSTTFASELLRNKSRIIVIDFWASWCVPCREAFPDLQKMKAKFNNSKVTFIGISLDADTKTEAWTTALKQEKLSGQPHQFKLKDTKTSPLFNELYIPSIPRYMVISNTGRILNSDFYGPQTKEFAIMLNKYLKQKKL